MTEYSTPGMGTYGSTWQHGGYSGQGNVGGLLDSEKGRAALICGNAETVFADYAKAIQAYPNALVFGVNDVGMYLPTLHHWVSLHGDRLKVWKPVRWLENRSHERAWLHSTDVHPQVDYVWAYLNPLFALSGYFAMQIAWLMGCRPILLCGCPGLPMRRWFDVKSRDTFGYGGGAEAADTNIQQQVVREMKRVPELKQAVRSMSGWTQEFFGSIEGDPANCRVPIGGV